MINRSVYDGDSVYVIGTHTANHEEVVTDITFYNTSVGSLYSESLPRCLGQGSGTEGKSVSKRKRTW